MLRALAAALALALALPAPAFAAWDWTSWTMSDKDVIAGSGGRVSTEIGGPNDRVNDWWLRAAGDLTQDDFDFHAEFYFDKKGEALHVVRLSLKDPGQCKRLARLLTKRHGAPRDESSPIFEYTLTVLEWDDDGKDNFLALTALPAIGTSEAICFIRYRPIGEGAT